MRELVVDSFAGGGGASLGITMALGRGPDVAINHDAAAIAMHAANHPETRHYTEDVWKVSPRRVTKGRRVGLLWCSPDCKHFSRAKGAKPVNKSIRSLAWVIVKWAAEARPRVIILENVREFADWGPLVPRWSCQAGRKFGAGRLTKQRQPAGCGWSGTEGQTLLARSTRRCPRCNSSRLMQTPDQIPDPDRKGLTFKRFVGRLRNLGYAVEWRNLNAAEFGAPTHRRRLFLVARNDGQPIVWPEPTHCDPNKIGDHPLFGQLQPYRTAAECIDWSLPCKSIFDRKRPLAEKTLRRIALGLKRYVLDNPNPFIVSCNHAGEEFRGQSVDEPMRTVTASRDAHGVVTPYLAKYHSQKAGESRCHGLNEPVRTLDTQNRYGVVAPTVAPYVMTNTTRHVPTSAKSPLPTVTTGDHHYLCSPTLIQTGFGEREGQAPRVPGIDKPLGTVVAGGQKHALVTAFMAQFFGGVVGKDAREPLPTVTAIDHNAVFAAHITKFRGDSAGHDAREPLPTITSGAGAARPSGAAHALAVTSATLVGVGGRSGQSPPTSPAAPVGTVTAKADRALATATLIGVGGADYSGKPRPADAPKGTVLPNDRTAVAAAYIARFNHGEKQWNATDEPLGTITSQGNKFGLVYAFLAKYYATAVGQGVDQPLDTVTSKHRFGVVMVEVAPGQTEPAVCLDVPGVGPCVIADIGLRMLTPRELARAQGFTDDYILTGSKSSQVARVGNSVCPVMAKVLVEANYTPARAGVAV